MKFWPMKSITSLMARDFKKVFEENLHTFINSVKWTFAKTMQDWPHEYIVREKVNEILFCQLVLYIRNNGYAGKFYKKEIIYFDEDGFTYWTMGAPIEETKIINRCKKEDSFEYRLENNLLPK